MFPYIEIFGKEITSYAIMAIIGILLAGFFCVKQAQKNKVDDNKVIVFLLIVAIGVLIGGHLLYGLVNLPLLIKFFTNLDKINSFDTVIAFLQTIFGGSVFYGGLLGGLLAGFIYGRVKKLDLKLYSYIITPAIPLFHFFGRIGCFLSGCCYGIESKVGFLYTNSLVEPANGVNRFPVQLLEAFCNLIIFILLYHWQKKKKYYDCLLPLYLSIYSFCRFFLEFLRGDTYRGFIGIFSVSQFISIIIFVISTLYIIYCFRKKKNRA